MLTCHPPEHAGIQETCARSASLSFARPSRPPVSSLPEDRDLYCSTVAMIHYARAVAHSALGSVAEAEAEKALFTAAKTRVPESRRVFACLMSALTTVWVSLPATLANIT